LCCLQGEKWLENFFDVKIVNDFLKKEHILVNTDKSAIEDPILEQTSIKA
jgi:hypothetical protein